MRAARIILVVGGVIMVGVGLLFLLRPTALSAGGGGIILADSAGRTEIRAVYGGIELGIGAFLLWAARRREHFMAGLAMTVALGAGAALGRAVGFAAEGVVESRHLLWGALELAGAIVAIWAMRLLRADDKAD